MTLLYYHININLIFSPFFCFCEYDKQFILVNIPVHGISIITHTIKLKNKVTLDRKIVALEKDFSLVESYIQDVRHLFANLCSYEHLVHVKISKTIS